MREPGKAFKAGERWGIIRHGSSGGVASFDGWYGGKRPAMAALEYWCGEHARWSLSLIEECEVDHPESLTAMPRMGRDETRERSYG